MWYKTPKPMFIRPYELPHEVYYFANCAFTAYWYACPFIFFCFSHHNSYNGKVNSSADSNEIQEAPNIQKTHRMTLQGVQ